MAFLKHHSDQARGAASDRAHGFRLPMRAAAVWRAGTGVAWLACLLLSGLPASAAEEAPLSEHQVKAAQMLNFFKYSHWPASAFAKTNSPYVIGVVGRDPFGKDLDRMFELKVVTGRPFVIKRTTDEQELRNCSSSELSSTVSSANT